ncbi:hypothetical protein [Campylobacter showae]|nr:hypothetical protein [Campylobacter showae]
MPAASQVGKAKARTANKQSANEPSKDARDKASVNLFPLRFML